MRTGISFTVSSSNRKQLEALVSNGNTLQKHVWRARIVLLSADGVGTQGIMDTTGKSKTTVWRWQARTLKQALPVFCPTRPARLARSRRHRAALMK